MTPLHAYVEQVRRDYVSAAVIAHNWDIRAAALALHVSLASAYRILNGDLRFLQRCRPVSVKPDKSIRRGIRHYRNPNAIIVAPRKRPLERDNKTENLFRFFGCCFTDTQWRKIRKNERELNRLCEIAHSYRSSFLKLAHPDMCGSHELIYKINDKWNRLKRAMKLKGIEL